MPVGIKGYRVFLSWQEGLEDERDAFFQAVDLFNKKRAIPRGFLFIPVDWKTLPGGFGRAQTKINLTLNDCDYLVVTFGDRWGTPPNGDDTGDYTSGTEEEYEKAKEYLDDEKRPMQDILICFKEISERQLRDPEEQLVKVLEFKKKAKTEGLLKNFKSIEQFKELITDHLEAWMRSLEYPNQPPKTKVTVIDTGNGAYKPVKVHDL
jgi:hypothetical protein